MAESKVGDVQCMRIERVGVAMCRGDVTLHRIASYRPERPCSNAQCQRYWDGEFDRWPYVGCDPHGKHEKLEGDCWLEPSGAYDGRSDDARNSECRVEDCKREGSNVRQQCCNDLLHSNVTAKTVRGVGVHVAASTEMATRAREC
jgi:hypothetical protein